MNLNKLTGKFIVLDGPDGCGKSTQVQLLADYLSGQGLEVVKTHDPGGTRIGDQIRHLLKYGAKGEMHVRTEALLFMASRAQLVAEIIEPAIKAGKTVLCDRYISSTYAYQGAGGYPTEKIIELGKLSIGDVWPNLTIVIDIPPEEGRARTGQKPGQRTITEHKDAHQGYLLENARPDRFDFRTLEFHRKVRKWFIRLKDEYPGVVKIIDGSNADMGTVHERIKQVLLETDF